MKRICMNKTLGLSTWIAVLGLAWIGGCFYNVRLSRELSWVHSIYQQKMAVAAQSEGQGRLLILGGSGTHMGIDAQQIALALDQPTFNMGLHAGLGLNAILASVVNDIQPGDVVILSPEYAVLADEDGIGRLAGQFGIITGRLSHMGLDKKHLAQEWLALGTTDMKSLYGTALAAVQGKAIRDYYSDELDAWGSPVELKIRSPQPSPVTAEISMQAYQRLQAFKGEVDAAGGTLLFSLPWKLDTLSDESVVKVRATAEALAAIAPVLHDDNFNLKSDPALFGDTVYHLSYEGRTLRSQQMAQQLAPFIQDISD